MFNAQDNCSPANEDVVGIFDNHNLKSNDRGGTVLHKYSRCVMWSEEDKCFVAEVIELPGCKSDGETVVEAIEKLDIIIEEWVETATKLGREIPQPFVL